MAVWQHPPRVATPPAGPVPPARRPGPADWCQITRPVRGHLSLIRIVPGLASHALSLRRAVDWPMARSRGLPSRSHLQRRTRATGCRQADRLCRAGPRSVGHGDPNNLTGQGSSHAGAAIWKLGTPEFIHELIKRMNSYMKKSCEFIVYMNHMLYEFVYEMIIRIHILMNSYMKGICEFMSI